MGIATALFAVAAAAIVTAWAWLGAAVQMPPSPLAAGEKLYCVSYTPFRGSQSPLGPDIPVDPRQIDEDLAQLKHITDCVRTYSVDFGLDQIAQIAKRHGMKVLQGLWLSNRPELSRKQVETAIALANRFPDVIAAVIVGNKVLLRGEMSAPDLVRTIREVKAQVPVPVTYADVWEFWLRHRDVATAVDFVTIHILPYWEDFPIPARNAAAHVDAIRARVVAAFPGKEVFVGEFGWPSAGRMREGALPSPVNQARTMHEVLDHAERENYRVNLIEAYDQPWKRQLEGTVGGHWGLFDAYQRQPKFGWGGLVSNHPHWRWQAAGGVGLAAVVFATALGVRRRTALAAGSGWWSRIAAMAIVSGFLIGWTLANVPVESLTIGDWLRSLAWAGAALASPVIGAAALASGTSAPTFAQILGRAAQRPRNPVALALGVLLIALAILAVQAALGLVFDPRYRDFPFASLSGATAPLLLVIKRKPAIKGTLLARWKRHLQAPAAESAVAATLAASAVYIACNESFANWQAVWLSAALIALAFTLLQAQDAPG
ncbi:MAG TPA: beta-(1-6) glucans synthase [Xanthobacteraceae bacterium]|nr:beta-(1-6) glucans synthase [Xanthobacteraceae bacterium]